MICSSAVAFFMLNYNGSCNLHAFSSFWAPWDNVLFFVLRVFHNVQPQVYEWTKMGWGSGHISFPKQKEKPGFFLTGRISCDRWWLYTVVYIFSNIQTYTLSYNFSELIKTFSWWIRNLSKRKGKWSTESHTALLHLAMSLLIVDAQSHNK